MKKLILLLALVVPLTNANAQVVETSGDELTAAAPANPDFVILSFVMIKDEVILDYKKAALPYAALTRKESGNLGYVIHQSAEDPHKFMMYEHWKSPEARARHLAMPYTVKFLGEAPKLYFQNGSAPVRMNYQVVDGI